MFSLISFALAGAPSGYTELKSGNDCTIYKGPATASGVIPIYASCSWPDVPAANLHKKLSNWEGHAAVHATVQTSKVVKTEGNKSLVHQVHELSGVSNREVQIWMEKKAIPGGFEYVWKSPGPVATPAKGNVATAQHEGYWKVVEAGAGSKIEYSLTYDPGGSVPGFLIRWFQGSGTLTTTEELRAAGK